MIAYVLSASDLSIKDLIEYEQFSFVHDIELNGKSEIVVARKPDILNDDLIFCRDGNETLFVGICESYESNGDDEEAYKITMTEACTFFDRDIFVGSESTIASTGLEDFIAEEITANWISSGDAFLDKDWLTVNAVTHNRISATVSSIMSADISSVYNFKTFLGNCLEKYGIVCDFVYSSNGIRVDIKKDAALTVPLDTKISDVVGLVEEYSADVLAKLNVKWLNTTTQAVSTAAYFLKTDRTITTNASDPNRAEGVIKSVYYEAASQEEMQESALQEFNSNSYQHKISLSVNKDSRAYPVSDYYVGRKATIKTKTGIQSTLITGTTEDSNSNFVGITFGKLAVTLIEKLRGKVK